MVLEGAGKPSNFWFFEISWILSVFNIRFISYTNYGSEIQRALANVKRDCQLKNYFMYLFVRDYIRKKKCVVLFLKWCLFDSPKIKDSVLLDLY